VLSYNIHHGRGLDGEIDLPRIAEVIKRLDPDIVALQEVDVRTERASGVDQADVLGRLTAMEKLFVPAMRYRGGLYGEALLTKLPVLNVRKHSLPVPMGGEPRAVLDAELRLGDGLSSITVLATHLCHEFEENRSASTEFIDRFLTADDARPFLLLGDLNARPESLPMQKLRGRWQDAFAKRPAPTFPSMEPDRRIDYVLFRPENRWEVIDQQVIVGEDASDHCPILVTIRLKDAPAMQN
jgi:endonuclease/exonuclease/phosphatase family metal-dependent hydrolase